MNRSSGRFHVLKMSTSEIPQERTIALLTLSELRLFRLRLAFLLSIVIHLVDRRISQSSLLKQKTYEECRLSFKLSGFKRFFFVFISPLFPEGAADCSSLIITPPHPSIRLRLFRNGTRRFRPRRSNPLRQTIRTTEFL